MSDEAKTQSPERRAKARRLFSDAQELSSAAEYEKSLRLLRRIPKSLRGADYDRIRQQVEARLEESEQLTGEILTAIKKSKSTDIVLPMVQRLVELKPGDEWANNLRHRLEAEQQESRSKPGGLFRFKRNNSATSQSPVAIESADIEPIIESDSNSDEESVVETEGLDDLGPIELIPVRPPKLPAASNGTPAGNAGRPRPSSTPPPLPQSPQSPVETKGMSPVAQFAILAVLLILLAAICVAFAVVMVKGPGVLISFAVSPHSWIAVAADHARSVI